MSSSSRSRNVTRFTGGNIIRGVRAEVAERCRRGKGLLRRMLRAVMGRV